MTIEEFNQTRFSAGMTIHHALTDKIYHVVSVDFAEKLIGIPVREFFVGCDEDDEDIYWMRCENCEIIIE